MRDGFSGARTNFPLKIAAGKLLNNVLHGIAALLAFALAKSPV